MNKEELTDQCVALVDESGLLLTEKVAALRKAMTRVQMNVSPATAMLATATHSSRKVPWTKKPLTRPSGEMMGKQKRVPKSE